MSAPIVIGIALGYVCLLFLLAYYGDRLSVRGRSLANNPYTYALSLAVYCTAWTYFGSVGRAADTGLGFLPIYLGPTIVAPLFMIVLHKIIRISKHQRITSIADFISSRYGKSTSLGALVSMVLLFGIIPYISLQLKAIAFCLDLLIERPGVHYGSQAELPFFQDTALYIAIALAFFTILFGVRKLDPNERHEGLVAAIAFESVIKLLAFLSIGLFVTFHLFDGFADLFRQAAARPDLQRLLTLQGEDMDSWTWLWLVLISMFAILLLPRQFHMAVVENTDIHFTRKASWLFPLYLLLINIFVLPIALGGKLLFPESAGVQADTFVISIPLLTDNLALAVFAGLGGLSAATSMVIVSVITLSIMISNNLLLPTLLRSPVIRETRYHDVYQRLLGIRRVSVVVVLLLAYGFYRLVGEGYSLVSIGLISFTAVAQLAPALFGGLYWQRPTRKGAMAGLTAGFLIWAYTLPLANLAEIGLLPPSFLAEGPWGMSWLRPQALFGIEEMNPVAHSAFWSLFFNTLLYVGVSLNTRQNMSELSQASLFVNIHRFLRQGGETTVLPREARVADIALLLSRFLGEKRAEWLLYRYAEKHRVNLSRTPQAGAGLIDYAETQLSGAIGAASAKAIIGTVVQENPISFQDILEVLDETREIRQYSRALEQKSIELEDTTRKLRKAHDQLLELDRLKADFINTVTHELRTPITSIKAFSRILLDNPKLAEEKREHYLSIVVSECERISRLINQVLDLRKLEEEDSDFRKEEVDLNKIARQAFNGLQQLFEDKQIATQLSVPEEPLVIYGLADKLVQVVVNLLSNAVKFCDAEQGEVSLTLEQSPASYIIAVKDNGPGIAPENQEVIFEKFQQLSDRSLGKPQGSGLGLFISRRIVEKHGGEIAVQSSPGNGATFILTFPRI